MADTATVTATPAARTSMRATVWITLGLLGVLVVAAAVQAVQLWGPAPLIIALVALAAVGWVWLAWRGRKDNRTRSRAFARAAHPVPKPRRNTGAGGRHRPGRTGTKAKATPSVKRRTGGAGGRPKPSGLGTARRPRATTAARSGGTARRPGASRSSASRRSPASRAGTSRAGASRSGGTSPRRARAGARGRIPAASRSSRRDSAGRFAPTRRPAAGSSPRHVNPRPRSRSGQRARGLAGWANTGRWGTRVAKYASLGLAVPLLLLAAGLWQASWRTGRWAGRKLDMRRGSNTLARKAWTSLWLACASAKQTVFPPKGTDARGTPGLPTRKPEVAPPVAPATSTTTRTKRQVARPVRPSPVRSYTMHPALTQISEGVDSLSHYRPEGLGNDRAVPVLEAAEFGAALSELTSNFHTQLAAVVEHYAEHSPYRGFVAGLRDVVNGVLTSSSAAEEAWRTLEAEEEPALSRIRNQEANETGRDVMAHDQ